MLHKPTAGGGAPSFARFCSESPERWCLVRVQTGTRPSHGGSNPRSGDPTRRFGLPAGRAPAALRSRDSAAGPGRAPAVPARRPPPARPAPARISILNRRLSVPQPRPALLPELPGPWEWRRLRSHRTVQKRPEDASGPGAIDNEAAGAAARPGPCAPRPHLPARPSLRLTVLPPFRRSAHPPRWRMAGRPRPGPQHSGRAAHGLVGARGALPAA